MRRGVSPIASGRSRGRPKGSTGVEHILPDTPDDLIRAMYPDALLGLIRARQAAGKTLIECAGVLGLRTGASYGKLEKGRVKLSLVDASALSRYLDLPLDQFF